MLFKYEDLLIKNPDLIFKTKNNIEGHIDRNLNIEASSSHGDFPVAIKSYRKLIGEIITYWTIHNKDLRQFGKDKQKKDF